MMSIIRMGPLS